MNIVRSVLKINMIARALHSYYFRSCVNYHRPSDNVIMGRKVPVSSTNFNNNVQKTAVMIRLSSQRILSSSSSSPRRERKKSKTFTSPNRFADIASNDTNGCSVSSRPQTPTMVMGKANIPHSELKALLFFYVLGCMTNFSAFNDVLNKITCENGFSCTSGRWGLAYLIVLPIDPWN